MGNLPPDDLLKATHSFPGPYVFKVISKSETGQLARMVAAVRSELTEGEDPPYTVRQTPSGRHISVTFEPTVRDAAQVAAIYRRIEALPGLVMLW